MKIFHSKKAFTLVELTIVIAVLMVLVAIALPVYYRSIETARKKLCVSQQKTLMEAASLYEIGEKRSLQDVGSQRARLEELVREGYIKSAAGFECPSSPVQDYDDYQMIFTDGSISDIECTVEPVKHRWP